MSQIKSQKIELSLHIGILGDEKCGKTTMIRTFLTKSFKETKQNSIINSQKIFLSIENHNIELILTEMNIAQHQGDKVIKNIIGTMDVFFICHEICENDEKFNEEMIKRYISYISGIKPIDECLIYVVGCKLDNKQKELKDKSAYIIDTDGMMSLYGHRIKTFVNNNPIKKFICTSSFLNYNIDELFEDAIVSFGIKKAKLMKGEKDKDNKGVITEEGIDDNCIIY